MKAYRFRYLKALVYILMGFLCVLVPVTASEADSDENSIKTIDVVISSETRVYDELGTEIGTLKIGEDEIQIVFSPVSDDTEPWETLVRYTMISSKQSKAGEDIAVNERAPVQLVPSGIESESSKEPNPAITSDSNAQLLDGTETIIVWIDKECIIASLEGLAMQDGTTVKAIQLEIEMLEKTTSQIPIQTNDLEQKDNIVPSTPITTVVSDDNIKDNYVNICVILCAMSVILSVIAACFVWLVISKKKILDPFLEKAQEISSNIERLAKTVNEWKVSISNRPERSDVSEESILALTNAIASRTRDVYETGAAAQVKKNGRQQETTNNGIISSTNGTQESRLLSLVNGLSGIARTDEWIKKVENAGFEFKLLSESPDEDGVYVPAKSKMSLLACLIDPTNKGIGYIIPSYQDPNASDTCWEKFYDITESSTITGYRMTRVTEVKVTNGDFFSSMKRGVLVRQPR